MPLTISPGDVIVKINKSKYIIEVFEDLSKWNDEYKAYAKLIHPDICKIPGAKDALSKLNSYREELQKGKTHADDAGCVTYKTDKCSIVGDVNILNFSLKHFNKLISYKDKIDLDFQRYLPKSAKITTEDSISTLEFNLPLRCIPISALGTLPQGHVNWIFSRMLEFIAYIYKKGYVHAGINPDSIYVEPVNHGINAMSFYHMTEIGKKLGTASGKYLYMYPDHVRVDKIATPDIDIELCKRTAIYLLGDKSGIGTMLRKTHSLPFLDFIGKRHTDPIQTYIEFRKLLDDNFERKFLPLSI